MILCLLKIEAFLKIERAMASLRRFEVKIIIIDDLRSKYKNIGFILFIRFVVIMINMDPMIIKLHTVIILILFLKLWRVIKQILFKQLSFWSNLLRIAYTFFLKRSFSAISKGRSCFRKKYIVFVNWRIACLWTILIVPLLVKFIFGVYLFLNLYRTLA